MNEYAAFAQLSTTTLADVVGRAGIMDSGIRPLWAGAPRMAGPAYPVRCPLNDNLMLHAAIYRAAAGSVIVVESGERHCALAGGNVCAVAQQRGIAGFVLDGLVRDIGEIRARGIPIHGRGVTPIAAPKGALGTLNEPIRCGGAAVAAGDVVVADEDGVVVVPRANAAAVLAAATLRAVKDAGQSLADWQADHQRRVAEALRRAGFQT